VVTRSFRTQIHLIDHGAPINAQYVRYTGIAFANNNCGTLNRQRTRVFKATYAVFVRIIRAQLLFVVLGYAAISICICRPYIIIIPYAGAECLLE